jgi:hypothetical protein
MAAFIESGNFSHSRVLDSRSVKTNVRVSGEGLLFIARASYGHISE